MFFRIFLFYFHDHMVCFHFPITYVKVISITNSLYLIPKYSRKHFLGPSLYENNRVYKCMVYLNSFWLAYCVPSSRI